MKNKLQHPIFIISVLLLLLNDFHLKQAYGNIFTGKLSDFAGLFAFPFFFSCLFPRHKKWIHAFSAILFVWWKSPLSQSFIELANSLHISIGRTVDFTDYIALVCILASYWLFSRNNEFKTMRLTLMYSIVSISVFSFLATTCYRNIYTIKYAPSYYGVNQTYDLGMSTYEFIGKYNKLQQEILDNYTTYYIYPSDDGQTYYKTIDSTAINVKTRKIATDKRLGTGDTLQVEGVYYRFNLIQTGASTSRIQLTDIIRYEYHKNRMNSLELIHAMISETPIWHDAPKDDAEAPSTDSTPADSLPPYRRAIYHQYVLVTDSIRNKDKTYKNQIKFFKNEVIDKVIKMR